MVRLWDEMSETRVYEPKHEVFTAEELAEENVAIAPQERCHVVAWADGVFYKAPQVEIR